MVTGAVLIDIGEDLRFAGVLLGHFERLQDRTGVVLPATDVVHFALARVSHKGRNKACHIE